MATRSVLTCGGEAESLFQGFQITVSLSRNRKGLKTSPLLEARAREENSVTFWFTKTGGSFLGSERKVEEMAKMHLKL